MYQVNGELQNQLSDKDKSVKHNQHISDVEVKFQEVSKKLGPNLVNIDRLILIGLFHQIPDLPNNNNFK